MHESMYHDVAAKAATTLVEDANKPVLVEDVDTARVQAREHEETVWQSLVANRRAMVYVLYMLFQCTTFGYDALAGIAIISLPQFRRSFGFLYQGDYVVPAQWQLGFSGASLGGLAVGGIMAGLLAEKFGRKWAFLFAFTLNVAGIFAQYFALGSRPLFLVGKILTGLPLGFYQALSPAYTSEVLPLRLRGAATSATVLAIVLGQFMAFVAIRIVTTIPGSTAYQHVFAVQWGFSGVGLAFLYFVPESPYFLVARGRIDKATKSILKLYGKNADVQSRLADIKASLDQVTGGTEEATGLMACFHKEHRKRTILALCMFFIQTQSGTAWVLSYIGYFLQLGGKTPLAANNISLIVIAMTLIGNVLGWPLIDKLGRRAVIVYGCTVLSILLLLIGILGSINSSSALTAQIVCMALWAVTYPATLGGVSWPLATEIPASKVRNSTLSLCVFVNGAGTVMWSFILPYLVNPNEADLQGKVGFIFGGLMALGALYSFFFVPETKGRTFREIDQLFASHISPRKFHKTQLEIMEVHPDEK